MLRVGVVHDSLRVVGGGERVCLKTIEALKEQGHQVVLGTVEPTDWTVLDAAMGNRIRPDNELSLLDLSENPLRTYMSVLSPVVHAIVNEVTDICVQTNGDVVPLGPVSYMHYLPASIYDDGSYRQGSAALRKLYSGPYRGLYHRLIARLEPTSIAANSNFTRMAIKKLFSIDVRVIYPPVEIERFVRARGQHREKRVVTCGRFSPEKNFEVALELAGKLPEYQFCLIGTVLGGSSRAYFDRLKAIAESKDLRNVELVQNESFENMLSLLGTSRVFLSCKTNEPFGLSVVEGMAAGTIPLVHRSGGPWMDSIGMEDGVFGYSYGGVEEAVPLVAKLLANEDEGKRIEERNRSRVEIFSDGRFKRDMLDLIMAAAQRAHRTD